METLTIVVNTLLWTYFVVTSVGFIAAYRRQKNHFKK